MRIPHHQFLYPPQLCAPIQLEVVTNIIYKVVIPQMNEDQDDCHIVEGDRDLSFSFLTQMFSHKCESPLGRLVLVAWEFWKN